MDATTGGCRSTPPTTSPRPASALAVEPMTAPPNALATGEDLLAAPPAPRRLVTLTWGIRAVGSPAQAGGV